MAKLNHNFYDTFIGRIVIGVSIFISGNLFLGLIWFIGSSAQPQKCKLENSEVRQMIISLSGIVESQGKQFGAFVARSDKREAVDSTRYYYIMKK